MREPETKICSHESGKHKYKCEEPVYEEGLCFWHSDIQKDDFTIKQICCEKSPELKEALAKYNFNIGTMLRKRAKEGTRFVDFNLRGANLKASDLSGVDLRYANFAGADFRGSMMKGVKLSGANLDHTLLSRVDLEDADLRGASLERADIRWSNLRRVLLSGARLEHADLRWSNLREANIYNANLCYLNLNHANLRYVKLSAYKYLLPILSKKRAEKHYRYGHYNDRTTFLGVNTNNINWANNRELKSFIIKQQFIDGFVKKSKINKLLWAPLWRYTCNYGHSIFRWFATACIVVLLFATIFGAGEGVTPEMLEKGGGMVEFNNGFLPKVLVNSALTWFTPVYFSIVTFTTLGFGDVVPLNFAAQIFVSLEVLVGYIMLGGLMTIFAEKFIIRE